MYLIFIFFNKQYYLKLKYLKAIVVLKHIMHDIISDTYWNTMKY